jgi:hypothetical protein
MLSIASYIFLSQGWPVDVYRRIRILKCFGDFPYLFLNRAELVGIIKAVARGNILYGTVGCANGGIGHFQLQIDLVLVYALACDLFEAGGKGTYRNVGGLRYFCKAEHFGRLGTEKAQGFNDPLIRLLQMACSC